MNVDHPDPPAEPNAADLVVSVAGQHIVMATLTTGSSCSNSTSEHRRQDMTSIVPAMRTGEVSPVALRATLGHFCTGITVITAMSDAGAAGFTCQSFSALSLDPPLVLLCPSRTSTSWPRIARADAFTVSVIGAGHEQLCRDFAVPGADKFAGREWVTSSRTGAPVPPEALAVIDCVLEDQHDGGDHIIATARVLGVEHTDGDPVLFFRSGFRRLAT